MARTADVTGGTVISSAYMNGHFADYVSQTATTDQNLASDLEVVTGKEIRTNTILSKKFKTMRWVYGHWRLLL
jgi:hypothetical protein